MTYTICILAALALTLTYVIRLLRHRFKMTEENAAISLSLPEFYRPDVRLWFLQAEAAFAGSNITQDSTKNYKVVARLDGSLLAVVADILETPPAEEKYSTLKKRLLDHFGESKKSTLDKLLHYSNTDM